MSATASRLNDPQVAERARTFDFRRPNKLSRDHVRNLQIVHETFARQLSTLFSSTLRVVSGVSVLSIEQLAYDEYIRDTPNPTHLSILSIDPLPGVAIFQLPLPTAFTVVDLMLGGHGRGETPERPLTDIERGLVRSIIDRALGELVYAFESVARIEPEVIGHESNPQFAQVAAPSDMCVVISFEVRIGSEENVASLCFPYAVLQPILDTIVQASSHSLAGRADAAQFQARLTERLLDVPVELRVELEPARLTSSEIVGLRVGDVVHLAQPVESVLAAKVGETLAFHVRPARAGKRLACQIVSLVRDPRELVDTHQQGASR